MLGGWQLNGIATLLSGFPFTPQIGSNRSGDGDTRNPDRPSLNPAFSGPVMLGQPEPVVQSERLRAAGRGDVREPGPGSVDRAGTGGSGSFAVQEHRRCPRSAPAAIPRGVFQRAEPREFRDAERRRYFPTATISASAGLITTHGHHLAADSIRVKTGSMRRSVVLLLTVLVTGAWGPRGHQAANRAAVKSIPADGPTFLAAFEDWIAKTGPLPDSWRGATEPYSKIFEDPNHGWFKEQFSFLTVIPRSRYEFVLKLYDEYQRIKYTDPARAALTNVRWTGTLPYAAMENYDRMKSAMRTYRGLIASKDAAARAMPVAGPGHGVLHGLDGALYGGRRAATARPASTTMAGWARIPRATPRTRACTAGSSRSSWT